MKSKLTAKSEVSDTQTLRNSCGVRSNASAKRAIAEVSAIADLKIGSFGNSEKSFGNRAFLLVTRAEEVG